MLRAWRPLGRALPTCWAARSLPHLLLSCPHVLVGSNHSVSATTCRLVRRMASVSGPGKDRPGRLPQGFEKFYRHSPRELGALWKNKKKEGEEKKDKSFGFSQLGPRSFTLAGLLVSLIFLLIGGESKRITWQDFVNDYLGSGDVERLVVMNKELVRVYVYPEVSEKHGVSSANRAVAHFSIGGVETFERNLAEAQRRLEFDVKDYIPVEYARQGPLQPLILNIVPTLFVLMVWYAMLRWVGGSGSRTGMGIFDIAKAKPNVLTRESNITTTFKDVAGLEEAKQEVMEFVSFLQNPSKYTELGAKIPKGGILMGPPGCGKTLLARATAGEASVPFYSISGSDFIEMFVGVGPARVRDLFARARENVPCIVFIDEIDAVGRSRSKGGFSAGHDERESTLNQLLVEMDGFTTNQGIVVLAGTNRADVLDKALLRPGRFDRQIHIDPPDLAGRKDIYKVHLRPLKLAKPVEYYAGRMAALTPGFSGAEIANVCNEAALIAARTLKAFVDMSDLEQAIDRVIAGLEKKSKILSPEEREIVAHHESGHAVAGWFLEHADPLLKVSIIPRGMSLGHTQYVPGDIHLYNKEQLLDQMCMTLGGRASESIIFGKISTGAQDDLRKVTSMAYAQVAQYGMSEKIGHLSFPSPDEVDAFTGKPFSDATAQLIDEEVRKLVNGAFLRVVDLLTRKRVHVEELARLLLEKEIVHQEDIIRICGERPFKLSSANQAYLSQVARGSGEVEFPNTTRTTQDEQQV